MTDGIVQEVFSEMEQRLIHRGYSFEKEPIVFISLNKVRQELIKKISLTHPLHDNAFCSVCVLKKYLIGDSKE